MILRKHRGKKKILLAKILFSLIAYKAFASDLVWVRFNERLNVGPINSPLMTVSSHCV